MFAVEFDGADVELDEDELEDGAGVITGTVVVVFVTTAGFGVVVVRAVVVDVEVTGAGSGDGVGDLAARALVAAHPASAHVQTTAATRRVSGFVRLDCPTRSPPAITLTPQTSWYVRARCCRA